MNSESAILLRGLRKRYQGHLAVEGLDLTVPRGTIFGLLGPNGAGKSTTLRMILAILARDQGEVMLLGKDPEKDRGVLNKVGYLPEERGLYKKMTALDAVVFFARLKGVPASTARSRGREWLERMGLSAWGGKRIDTLSKGMQQKVQFITTVLHEPELLILDEPFSGLDPVNQEVLRHTVLDARKQGRTVLFSTHIMEHAEQICDRVAILSQGRKVADGSLREVRQAGAGLRYRLDFEKRTEAIRQFITEGSWFSRVEEKEEAFLVELSPQSDVHALLDALNRLDSPVSHFERALPTLREVFVARVGGSGEDTP